MLLALFVNVAILLPMLQCGYTMDDVITTCGSGFARQHQVSVLGYTIWEQIVPWAKAYGRFYPLAFHSLLFFSVIRSLTVYRIIGLLFVLLNVALFSALIARLTQARRLGVLGALLVPLMFEFRHSFDPFLSFCLMMQMTWGFLLGSFLLLDLHLEKARLWKCSLSLLLYILAVLTYEVAWPFFALHYLLIRLRRGPDHATVSAGRQAAPFLVVAGLFVLMALTLRTVFHVPFVNSNPKELKHRYSVQLSAVKNLQNVAKQVVAALPLSYRLLDTRRAMQVVAPVPRALMVLLGIGYVAATWLVLFPKAEQPSQIRSSKSEIRNKLKIPSTKPRLGTAFGALRFPICFGFRASDFEFLATSPEGAPVRNVDRRGLCLLALAVMILPTLLISLSAQHLGYSPWGTGYLPVYISYFGTALLLLSALAPLTRMQVVSKTRPRLRMYAAVLGLGGILGVVGIIDHRDNASVVKLFNVLGGYQRMMIQEALTHGLVQGRPEGCALWTANRWPWEEENLLVPFMLTYTGLRIEPASCGKYTSAFNRKATDKDRIGFEARYAESQQAYYLDYHADDHRSGFAVLGRITLIAGDGLGPRVIRAREVRLYVRLTPHHRNLVVHGRRLVKSYGDAEVPFCYESSDLKVVAGSRDWCLVDLPVEENDIDLVSLKVELDVTR
jgi:hypothetical protein